MSGCVKFIEENKCKSFVTKDNELLKKGDKIWIKSTLVLKKGSIAKPVYNEKYLKTKIKSYEGKINTNFHNNRISLSIILIDSVFKMGEKYCPQVFLIAMGDVIAYQSMFD